MSSNLCACLGPRQDEPFCMCVMIQKGLKTLKDYGPSDEDKAKLKNALVDVFNWRQPNGG